MAREEGVRGFPTLFFLNATGKKEIVYGSKPYSSYETALLKIVPSASKADYDKTWESVFRNYRSLTSKEFSVLTEMPRNVVEKVLDDLTENGKLEKLTTKNGAIWSAVER